MQFSVWLEESEKDNDELQDLIHAIEVENPEVEDLFAWNNGKHIHLSSIRIKKEFRNQGIGTKIIQKLKDYAASKGLPLILSPEADRGKKTALERFYKRNGLIYNKGRNKDYRLSSSMYWKPDQTGE